MSQKILQVNLKFNISRADLESAWLGAAQPIADTPGLLWKVWLMNEPAGEAGGIYLFEDERAVQAYLQGPIVASLKASPAVSDISAKTFDVLETHTAVTRGPAGVPVHVPVA
ncbi:MAG TPA: YdhR family protein [Thermoanaerobaculia bacterium]|nr:YdhR family protein [Thermoanaerobaculia bacterium]